MSRHTRGKNSFSVKWLTLKDGNGDELSDYILKTETDFSVRCDWCKKTFSIENSGKTQIFQHAKTTGHKEIADIRKGRKTGQARFVPSSEVSLEKENNNNTGKAGPSTMRNFVVNSLHSPLLQPGNKMTLSDKATRGELLLALKGIESQWSYASYDNLIAVLQLIDPESDVLKKIQMKQTKVGYLVRFAIGPYFHDKVVKDVRKAVGFTLGTDSATTKLGGLTKHMDIQIRYWSETLNEVVDAFLDSSSCGHEDAKKVTGALVEALEKDSLSYAKLLMLSRDSPKVMEKASRDLKVKVENEGCPLMLEGPCYLHPAHTAFKQAVKTLKIDIESFVLNIFGWFKLSTARREDMIEIFESLEEKVEFFLRNISSRWLTMGPCLVRVSDHYESIKKYFLDFLKNDGSQSDKKATKTDRYKEIVELIKPSEAKATLASIHFLILLTKISEPFLLSLQSTKPMIHQLHSKSVELLVSVMNLIVPNQKIPTNSKQLAKFSFEDESNLLKAKDCNFGETVRKLTASMDDAKSKDLKIQFKKAVIAEAKYLQSHLPLDNLFLAQLRFLNPLARKENKLPSALTKVAANLKRFDEEDLASLSSQLNIYQVLSDEEVPPFDEKTDRIDHYWRDIFELVEKKLGAKPNALVKLVKLCCSLSHGQAFVERGFSVTKRIGTGRESLSVESVNAQKTTSDEIKKMGGTENVTINYELINRAKCANMEAIKDKEKKEKEEMDRKRKREEADQEIERRNKLEHWRAKKLKLETEMKVKKAALRTQNKVLDDSLEKAMNGKSEVEKKAALTCSKVSKESIDKLNRELWEREGELKKLLSKRPSEN